MMQRVMSISILAKSGAAVAALTFCVAAPLAAQESEPDAKDVAMTPLTDLGLSADDIPDILLTAVDDPYASEELNSCVKIGTQIANLDRVLGKDLDLLEDSKNGISEGRVAQSVVGSIIPFRGIVREVSGAAGDERKLSAAVTAGMVRRGFLKGLGQQRGCAYPARPAPSPASE